MPVTPCTERRQAMPENPLSQADLGDASNLPVEGDQL